MKGSSVLSGQKRANTPVDSSCCSESAPSLSNYTTAHKGDGGGFKTSPPLGPAEINEPRLQSLQSSNTPQTMGPPAEGEYREEKSEEPLIKGLGDVVAKDFNCPLSMHNTGRALATQWDDLLVLLSGQGPTLKNSWCCRQDASRTPCKQPAEGFF